MASSNEFGMPVAISPPIPQVAQTAEITSKWMPQYPAKMLAIELSEGPPIPLPAVGDTFSSQNAFRITTMAHALQNRWIVYPQRHSSTSPTTRLHCSRAWPEWNSLVGGRCGYKIKGHRGLDGVVTVTEASKIHSHALDGLLASQSAVRPGMIRAQPKKKANVQQKPLEASEEEEAISTDQEEAIFTDDEESVIPRSPNQQAISAGSGGPARGSSRDGKGGKKRGREHAVQPRVVARFAPSSGSSRSPSPKRSSAHANAFASGSGSKGIPATQYHTGSASRPSITSHTTAAPPNTTVTPTAPLPWPRELARLVASVNPLLLSKSHTFSKLLIPIGVVNRHEFSKMIWSFGATDQHDKRMNWFKIHLRKGNELVEMDFMQFRIGATRICKGIPLMAS